MVLQSGSKNLVNGGVDVVFLLITGADAKTSFREVSAAAQGSFFFEDDRFSALVNCALSCCQTGQAAPDDNEVGLINLRCECRKRESGE